MPAAVGCAGDRDVRWIEIAIGVVHHSADHAAHVSDLEIEIRQIDLPPRLTKPTRGVTKNGVAVSEELVGDVPGAAFASGISVDQRDEGERPHSGWDLESCVERRVVCFAD